MKSDPMFSIDQHGRQLKHNPHKLLSKFEYSEHALSNLQLPV